MNSRKSYLLMLCLKEREGSSRERGSKEVGNSRRDLQEYREIGMTQSQPIDSKNFRLSHI